MGKAEIRTIEITLRVPEAIMDFLKSIQIDIEGYLVASILSMIEADIEEWFADPEMLINKYNLKPIFKEYNDFLYPFQQADSRDH